MTNAERRKRYVTKHPERVAVARRKWDDKNLDRRNEYACAYRYGLTVAQYRALLDEQRHSCAICGTQEKKLTVDHCHSTRVVRGMLCVNCNVGLGHFRDSVELLAAAIRYLVERKK